MSRYLCHHRKRYDLLIRNHVIPAFQNCQSEISEISYMQYSSPPHIAQPVKQLLTILVTIHLENFNDISRHFIHPSRNIHLTLPLRLLDLVNLKNAL